MRCNYSKKQFFRAYAIYTAYKNDATKLREELAKAFNDPERALNEIQNWIGKGETKSPSPVPFVAPIQVEIDENDVSTYFSDTAKYNQMRSKFKRQLLAASIFSLDIEQNEFNFIDGNSIVENTNYTLAQERILNFKNELVNKIVSEAGADTITFTLDSTDNEITEAIDTAINKYEEYMHTTSSIKEEGYEAYVMLKNFDSLIKNNSPYIEIDPSYMAVGLEGISKYSLKPRVTHYSGFSGKDESADIMHQLSDLSETILNMLPEIDSKGRILPTYVGTNGFNGAMETLKSALIYTPQFKEYRKSFHEGEKSLLDPDNEYNIVNLINAFIDANTVFSAENSSDFSAFRQVYIHNKLRSIAHYLFSDKTPAYIKNMFSRMFYKTEPTSYRSYQLDETNRFGAKTLESRMILNQKFAIQNIITGGIEVIRRSNVSNNIIKEYSPKITGNYSAETLTLTNGGRTVSIDYSVSNGFSIGNINGDEEVLKSFLQTAFSYIVPSGYATCMGETAYNWAKDFVPFIILGSKIALRKGAFKYGNYPQNAFNSDGTLNTSQFNTLFLQIGRRLGVIYGDSVKSVVSSLSGNKLPLFQLTSLEYNWQTCLYESRKNPNNALVGGIINSDEDLLLAPQLRNEVEANGEIKHATDLSFEEVTKLQLLDDFFFPYLFSSNSQDEGIYLQNAVFSDKARHFLMGWRLNLSLNNAIIGSVYGGKEASTLKKIIKDCLNNGSDNIKEVTRKLKMERLTFNAANVINDYHRVFPDKFDAFELGPDEDINAQRAVDTLLAIDEFLQDPKNKIDLPKLRKAFADKQVNFIEETHASIDPNTKKVIFNETFLNYLISTSTKEQWEKRTSFLMGKFVKDISSLELNGYDSTLNRKVTGEGSQSYFETLVNWKPEGVKEYTGFYNPNIKTFSFVSPEGKLHRIAEAYFYLNLLCNEEYNVLTLGEVWAHPNKGKVRTGEDSSEISEAGRYVNQIKRFVVPGSTIHSFAQGIKNDEGNYCGVTEKIKVAVFKDIGAPIFTPKGVEDAIKSQDGAGRCTALQSRLENNSVVDAYVGENKKTIMHDIRSDYSTPTLLKWAVYSITNAVRRISYSSNAGLEKLTEKMYSILFDTPVDIKTEYEEYIAKTGKTIWMQDPITLEMQELIGFEKDTHGDYVQILKNQKGEVFKGRTYSNSYSHTLYDIDQIFGGCFSAHLDEEGNFVFDESSVDMLEKIAIKYDLRDKQIAYSVNESACKVGAENMNPASSYMDDTDLHTFDLSTKFGGIMMDADHALDEGEVNGLTQMISSLIESGLCLEEAQSVYEDLAEAAINNKAVAKCITALNQVDAEGRLTEEAYTTLQTYLGASFVESFQSGTRDTIGLAQAFSKKFLTDIKSGKNGKLPVSDGTLFGAYVSNIVSLFNKSAIKKHFDGFIAVQNPTYNNIQYYGNGILFNEFNRQCLETFGDTLPHLEGLDENGKYHYYDSYADLAARAVTINGQLNPFFQRITKGDIDFEDTVFVYENGKYTKYYVDSFQVYDELKHLKDYSDDAIIYRNTASPKNLKGTDTKYHLMGVTANGTRISLGTYSYYENDAVRAAHYLNNKVKEDPYQAKKQALLDKLGVKTVEECNALTQQFLEKLKLGKEIGTELSLGNNVSDLESRASFESQEVFGDTSEYISFYSSDFNVIPAEIIIGRYQLAKLGIKPSDQISSITSSTFFEEKLKSEFEDPAWALDEETRLECYDKVLYHKGIPFLIKIGKEGSHLSDGVTFWEDSAFNTIGDDFRYNKEIIASNLEGIKGKVINDGINTAYYINVETEEDFEALADSDFFEDIYRNNVSFTEREKESYRVQKQITRLAEDRFEAFKELGTFVGTRIPTQNMQSYMPFKVIAYTDSELNEVYLPKQSIYLTGSDFDIDKLYLITCSLLNNGTLSSGSALQRTLGYKYTSKLFKPNNVDFVEGDFGIGIPSRVLERFSAPWYDWSEEDKADFVFLANKINATTSDGKATVVFERGNRNQTEWEKQKEGFLALLNKHSHSKQNIRNKDKVLRTRIFNKVKAITLSPEVQLKAQIAVDECTREFKAKAAETVSGNAEKQVTPDNGLSMFIMQLQNLLGKKVVGIGAVSLKTYYLLSYNANIKINKIRKLLNKQTLAESDIQEAVGILRSMLIKNPITGKFTIIANTNLRNIYTLFEEAFKKLPGKDDTETVKRRTILNTISEIEVNSSQVNASDYLSGIISLGADNAKDLALPKLNATEDLVDLYTTAFMLGTPFKEISDIMTSDIFNWACNACKENMFDSAVSFGKVKKFILSLSDTTNIPGMKAGTMDRLLGAYNAWAQQNNKKVITGTSEEVLNSLEDLDTIINTFEQDTFLLSTPKYITSEMWEAYNQMAEEAAAAGYSGEVLAPWTQADYYQGYRGLLNARTRCTAFLDENNINMIASLSNLITVTEQMSTLGRMAGINSGMDTSIGDFLSYGKGVENNFKPVETESGETFVFNFDRFITDTAYAQEAILKCNSINGFNILEAFYNSPNYYSMAKVYVLAKDVLKKTSFAFERISDTVDELLNSGDITYLSDVAYRELTRYTNDTLLYNFLTQSGISLNLREIASETGNPIERYKPNGTLETFDELKIETVHDVASFKHIMEQAIIPYLKSKYRDNPFIRDLNLSKHRTLDTFVFSLPIQMMQIDADEGAVAKYNQYLTGFNSIAKDSFCGNNIGDLFFIYNLITNKNSYGNTSLTRIFEDLVNSTNVPPIISSYYSYISDLDGKKAKIPFNEKEALYRIIKYAKAWTKGENLYVGTQINGDYTFDLPATGKLGASMEKQTVAPTQSKKTLGNISATEVISVISNLLNSGNRKIVSTYKDNRINSPKASIENGLLRFNLAALTGKGAVSVGIHELAHFVFAEIKSRNVDDPTRIALYALLDKIDSNQLATYAKYYNWLSGSDLEEEYICNKIENTLMGKLTDNTEVTLVNQKITLEGLKGLFKGEITDLSEVVNLNLEEAIEKFAGSIFNFIGDISQDYMITNQKVGWLKSYLINGTDKNNKLEQDCNG